MGTEINLDFLYYQEKQGLDWTDPNMEINDEQEWEFDRKIKTMKYKFKKIDFSYGTMPKDKITYDFGVDYESLDEKHKVLFEIAWHGWTNKEVQLIIDSSKALTGDKKYRYQVERSDLMIYVYKDNVYFFDKGNDGEEADLIWTFNEFIEFMKNFKKFLSDNGR